MDIRPLSYSSAVATYALILIGGYVSQSGSGLACPDWPTCNGQVFPTLSGPVLIEFSHRITALIVSLLVTATLLVAWRSYREFRGILVLSTLSFLLLMGQVFLGMVTVKSDLNPAVATAHLGLATGVFAVVLSTAILARDTSRREPEVQRILA